VAVQNASDIANVLHCNSAGTAVMQLLTLQFSLKELACPEQFHYFHYVSGKVVWNYIYVAPQLQCTLLELKIYLF